MKPQRRMPGRGGDRAGVCAAEGGACRGEACCAAQGAKEGACSAKPQRKATQTRRVVSLQCRLVAGKRTVRAVPQLGLTEGCCLSKSSVASWGNYQRWQKWGSGLSGGRRCRHSTGEGAAHGWQDADVPVLVTGTLSLFFRAPPITSWGRALSAGLALVLFLFRMQTRQCGRSSETLCLHILPWSCSGTHLRDAHADTAVWRPQGLMAGIPLATALSTPMLPAHIHRAGPHGLSRLPPSCPLELLERRLSSYKPFRYEFELRIQDYQHTSTGRGLVAWVTTALFACAARALLFKLQAL